VDKAPNAAENTFRLSSIEIDSADLEPQGTSPVDGRLAMLLSLVRQKGQNLGVAGLARALGVSGSHLRRLVHAEFRLSPRDLIRKRRFLQAADLLRRTALPVKEIMHLVGVTDASHFSRDFKRCFGVNPQKYRTDCTKLGLMCESANRRAIRPIVRPPAVT
jgi:AraC-like DNA-binding protein